MYEFAEPCAQGVRVKGNDNVGEIEYFSLIQHPRAKKIYAKFDPSKLTRAATLAETEHFRNVYPDIEIYLFFGKIPVSFSHEYDFINHNIRTYTLYKLAREGKIKLYAYDSSAALSALKIDAITEVLTPSTGRFVVTLNGAGSIDIVINFERGNISVIWDICVKRSSDFSVFDKMFKEEIKNCNYYRGKVFTHKGDFLALPNVTFNDIYLESTLRDAVKTNIIDYIDKDTISMKQKNGIPTKRGVIFVGAPGTGKTFLSRVLASTLDTTFMVITELTYLNEINAIFEFAKQFDRIILLFEDIDIYIKDREFGSSLLPTMLNKLDGVEVNNHIVVLCTTNDVDMMDKALKDRPGRFDRILIFDPPSKKLKAIMLKGFCAGKNIKKVNFKTVVKGIPEWYTGAHLKEIYITACNCALSSNKVDKRGIVLLTTELLTTAVKMVVTRKEPARIGFASIGFTSNG